MPDYKILIADNYPQRPPIIANILLKDHLKHPILASPNGKAAYEIASTKPPELIIMGCDMSVLNGMQATIQPKHNKLIARIHTKQNKNYPRYRLRQNLGLKKTMASLLFLSN